jgi:hypothetical protein
MPDQIPDDDDDDDDDEDDAGVCTFSLVRRARNADRSYSIK